MKMNYNCTLLVTFLLVACNGLFGMHVPSEEDCATCKQKQEFKKVYECAQHYDDENWLLEVLENSLDTKQAYNHEFVNQASNLPRFCPVTRQVLCYTFKSEHIMKSILEVEKYKKELLSDSEDNVYNKQLFILKSQLVAENLQYTLATVFPFSTTDGYASIDGFKEYSEAKDLHYKKKLMSSNTLGENILLELELPDTAWEGMQENNRKEKMREYELAVRKKYRNIRRALKHEIALYELKEPRHVQAVELSSLYKSTRIRPETE